MRPVQISDNAINAQGEPVVIQKYQDAKSHLQHQIGIYCVFCERKIPSSLAVEHKLPKSLPAYAHRELEWKNFVLGCANCNATKGITDTGAATFFFPDTVNTAYAFHYSPTNHVVLNPVLSAGEQEAAQRTLILVGLDRTELQPHTRWTQRGQAWEKAKRCREKVAAADEAGTWEYVVWLAEATGFWSVWMAVFHDHAEVRKRLIAAFAGTRTACFDADGVVVAELNR